MRVCGWCGASLEGRRFDARYCGGACKGGRGAETNDQEFAQLVRESLDQLKALDGLRSSTALGRGGVVGRAEAPMDVVVDDADVLHERVHTRRAHEAVPLRLQLLRERLRLRGRLG
jgi:hypothetical protein